MGAGASLCAAVSFAAAKWCMPYGSSMSTHSPIPPMPAHRQSEVCPLCGGALIAPPGDYNCHQLPGREVPFTPSRVCSSCGAGFIMTASGWQVICEPSV